MENNNSKKPWLGKDGKLLSSDEIKKACVKWGPEVWEEYLTTLEVEQEEVLFSDARQAENISSDCYYEYLKQAELPKFKTIIGNSIKELTLKQQQVIFLTFWKGYSINEAAKHLGVCKTAIQNLRNRALSQLGKSIVNAISNPMSKGDIWSLDESLPVYEGVRKPL